MGNAAGQQVLECDQIKQGEGVFRREHMDNIWPDLDLTVRDRLLRLMERFDLSYRIPDDPQDESLDVEGERDLVAEHRLRETPGGEWHEGADLRGLRKLLGELDPAQHWGGLKKVFTPEGHYFWLCANRAKEFKPQARGRVAGNIT